jgi:hypothetical protein
MRETSRVVVECDYCPERCSDAAVIAGQWAVLNMGGRCFDLCPFCRAAAISALEARKAATS